MLDQRQRAPFRNLLSAKERHEAAAIDCCRDASARKLGKGHAEIGVLDDLIDSVRRRNSRPRDDEWDVNVRIECGRLAGHQAMLAHVKAIVGTEYKISVLLLASCRNRRFQIADHLIDRE